MQFTNKKRKSFFLVWGFVFVCLASFSVFLLVTFSFYNNIYDKKIFSINALLVPRYKDTMDKFQVMPINYTSIKDGKDRTSFKNMLVKQYIVNRYTVNGRQDLMQKNLGLRLLTDMNTWYGIKMKAPSFIGVNNDGNMMFFDAYKNFVSGKDGEIKEIERLISENTTRSVRIVKEPKKVGDWTETIVEFIYNTPKTYSFREAKKELYKISMICDLIGLKTESFDRYDPSSVFAFKVEQISKEQL